MAKRFALRHYKRGQQFSNGVPVHKHTRQNYGASWMTSTYMRVQHSESDTGLHLPNIYFDTDVTLMSQMLNGPTANHFLNVACVHVYLVGLL